MARETRQGPFQNKVKEVRENEAFITQKELAYRLKKRGFSVTSAYVSQIEAGLKHIPYGLAVAICEELGYQTNRVTEIFLPENYTDSLDVVVSEPTPTLPKTG